MAKNLGHQNHVAAGFHKRRANASAALVQLRNENKVKTEGERRAMKYAAK